MNSKDLWPDPKTSALNGKSLTDFNGLWFILLYRMYHAVNARRICLKCQVYTAAGSMLPSMCGQTCTHANMLKIAE